MAKRVHWTQTPAGRKRMAEIASNRRTTPRGKVKASHAAQEAYAFGYTQAWLHSYAERTGIPVEALTGRVGALLQQSAVR